MFGEALEDETPSPIKELSECWYSVLDEVKKQHPGADQLEDRFYVENIRDGVIEYSTYGKDIGETTLYVLGEVIKDYLGMDYEFKHIQYLSPSDAHASVWPLSDDRR
jgi:hypothetical protein